MSEPKARVERYDLQPGGLYECDSYGCQATMEYDPAGEFVKYDDYSALLILCGELRKALNNLEEGEGFCPVCLNRIDLPHEPGCMIARADELLGKESTE